MVSSGSRIVLLDTSILFSIFERKLPLEDYILEEVGKARICIPESVINELKKLLTSSGARRRIAKAVLDYLKVSRFEIIESEHPDNVDDDLIALAEKMNAVVVTVDMDLVDALRKRSLSVMTWKNKRLRLI